MRANVFNSNQIDADNVPLFVWLLVPPSLIFSFALIYISQDKLFAVIGCSVFILSNIVFNYLMKFVPPGKQLYAELGKVLINVVIVGGVVVGGGQETFWILILMPILRATAVFKDTWLVFSVIFAYIVTISVALFINGSSSSRIVVAIMILAAFSYMVYGLVSLLKQTTSRFKISHTFFQQSADLFLMVTPDGTIVDSNSVTEHTVGYTHEELIGRTCLDLFTEESIRESRDFFEKWRRLGSREPVEREMQLMARSGKNIDVLLTVSAIKDRNSKVMSYVSVMKDLTEKKELDRIVQFEKAKSQQAAKLAALGEMAGSVAHEINNPLAIIQGYTMRLNRLSRSNKLETKELISITDKIVGTVERISGIVKGMKNLSRDGSSDPVTNVSVLDVIREVISFSRERFKTNQIELRIGPVDPKLGIRCRSIEISQVLVNLLNNARDAVAGCDEKWVEIGARSLGSGQVEIYVMDSGSGVSENIKDKIMNPFFTTKKTGEGTGLGLSISRGILESHDGDLFLDWHSSHTKFVIHLPRVFLDENVGVASL